MSINGVEWLLIFVVALILFGPKKLPELGRSLGKSLREFKKATSGMMSEEETGKETQAKTEEMKVENKKNEDVKTEAKNMNDKTKTPNL